MEESFNKQKPKISLDSYPVKGYDSASCIIDNETLIVDSKQSKLYVLNAAGTRIWELANGKNNVKHIIKEISKHSKKPTHQIRQETEKFIEELVSRQILVLSSHPIEIIV